jgi:hypothetical protein
MLRKLLLPDLALCLSALTMLYCLSIYGGRQNLFRDADTGWHIRNGERILQQSQWPQRDPFSFSRPQAPWFAWEWLADVLMNQAHAAPIAGTAGLGGVFLLYLGLLGLITWAWFQLAWASSAWFLVAALASSLMLTTSNIHWLARPHLFGWLLLLLCVLAAERGWVSLRFLPLLGVFATGVLWTNLHASFFLAPLVFGVYAADAWLRDKDPQPFALSALLLLLASLVNPYGWHLHQHVVSYLLNRDLLSLIGEFQSFQFHLPGSEPILAVILLVACSIPLLVQQKRFARAALSLLLLAMALRAARGLPLLALVALPFALGAYCEVLARFRPNWLQYNLNLRSLDRRFAGYALAPLLFLGLSAIALSPAHAEPIGFSPQQFPVQLSPQIEQLPPTARLFSSDKFGGYLIYRFAGQRQVFFDGRSDFYGTQFLKDYLLIPDTKPGWEQQWQRWNFSHALVAKDSPLAAMLPFKGWRKIGGDQVAILFEKGSN